MCVGTGRGYTSWRKSSLQAGMRVRGATEKEGRKRRMCSVFGEFCAPIGGEMLVA